MSNVALFATGSIVFIFLTWATLMFLYWRFNEIYKSDQDAFADGPGIVGEGDRGLSSSPETAEA